MNPTLTKKEGKAKTKTAPPPTVDPAQRWRWPAALAMRMQNFDCVMSKEMHVSHFGDDERHALTDLAPLGAAGINAWHRRYSRSLTRQQPALAARLPVMQTELARVVLLNREELAALATLCGVAILWPGIKTAIARDDVNRLCAALGETAYHWAIRHAPACHTGWLGSQAWTATQIVAACERLGWSTVKVAISDTAHAKREIVTIADNILGEDTAHAHAVVARFLLKLPADETMALVPADASALPSSKHALTLCQSLLSFLAYPWLSSFNACR